MGYRSTGRGPSCTGDGRDAVPEVEVFDVTFQSNGMPISTVTVARSDLEELKNDYDGAWRTLARAEIKDAAAQSREGELSEAYPTFTYGLGPCLTSAPLGQI
ncbi:YjbH domain-containing protein [Sulfitobacter faviae]|uniref:YjbH domain-containing protein n=1 Tax=Sulfitobacter faviae TaxID=1775881 RepID=UPI0024537C35|nr:YjbH domain-containing protein [Sulfitobacter faviae]